MKKLAIIVGLAALLCLAAAAQTMAAPSVSVKYMGVTDPWVYISVPQVELGVAVSDYFSLILQGGPAVYHGMGVVGGTVAAGLRCYLTPFEFRPFATLYGGLWFNGSMWPYLMGTAGLEYLSDSGFRVAGEAGVMYIDGDLPFVFGVSLGYQFY